MEICRCEDIWIFPYRKEGKGLSKQWEHERRFHGLEYHFEGKEYSKSFFCVRPCWEAWLDERWGLSDKKNFMLRSLVLEEIPSDLCFRRCGNMES